MNACEKCAIAAQRSYWEFERDCLGCKARSAARSPHFKRVRESGVLDRQYRALLEQLKLSHEMVKAAAATDAVHKEMTT